MWWNPDFLFKIAIPPTRPTLLNACCVSSGHFPYLDFFRAAQRFFMASEIALRPAADNRRFFLVLRFVTAALVDGRPPLLPSMPRTLEIHCSSLSWSL